MADIIVPINERTDPESLAYDIMQQVRAAASGAVMVAAEKHINIAKENVEKAYILGEQKISLYYAMRLIPEEVRKKQTKEENISMAEKIRDTKEGMVITGALLNGISVGALESGVERVAVDLLSMAPYSENLEWGVLFGSVRNKERRFFTKHLYFETIPTMLEEFHKNLQEGQ